AFGTALSAHRRREATDSCTFQRPARGVGRGLEEQPVRLDRRGAVGILTIDREDRVNALSRPTLYALGRLGRELVEDPAIRAIVVTGAGKKAFCAGADLKERRGMSNEDIRVQVGLYRSELGVIDRSP